jgi:Fur family transcriptional regulator, ferric uptake regulator
MVSSETIIERLREQGIRLTIQRQLVIEVLCQHNDHLLIQDVQQFLLQKGVDLNETTVYRILQWLKNLGIVSQTDLGQSGVAYQLMGEEPHHHLVCLSCGKIITVDNSLFLPLSNTLRTQFGFEPRIDHMAIFGLCSVCQQQDDSAPLSS